MNRSIKKVIAMSVLGASMALLIGCSDDNPLMKEPFKTFYIESFQSHMREKISVDHEKPCKGIFCIKHKEEYLTRINDDAKCPYYFSNPSAHEEIEKQCQPWFKQRKEILQSNQEDYAQSHQLDVMTLTEDDMSDPQFWTMIANAMDEVKNNPEE